MSRYTIPPRGSRDDHPRTIPDHFPPPAPPEPPKRTGHTADLLLAKGLRGILGLWGPAGAAIATIVSGATAVTILETKLDALEKKVDRIQSAEILTQRVVALEAELSQMRKDIPVQVTRLQQEVGTLTKRMDFKWKKAAYRSSKNPAAGHLEED